MKTEKKKLYKINRNLQFGPNDTELEYEFQKLRIDPNIKPSQEDGCHVFKNSCLSLNESGIYSNESKVYEMTHNVPMHRPRQDNASVDDSTNICRNVNCAMRHPNFRNNQNQSNYVKMPIPKNIRNKRHYPGRLTNNIHCECHKYKNTERCNYYEPDDYLNRQKSSYNASTISLTNDVLKTKNSTLRHDYRNTHHQNCSDFQKKNTSHPNIHKQYKITNIPKNNSRGCDYSNSHYVNTLKFPQNQAHQDIGICACCHLAIPKDENAYLSDGVYFHESCFNCFCCGRNLKNKNFYCLNSKLYCEADYHYVGFQNCSEKCAVCNHAIVDTVLWGLGKTYHQNCFRCTVCNCLLDGKQFTFDKQSTVYCEYDFHLKFAPKCFKCKEPIIPKLMDRNKPSRLLALDKDYHIECFKCEKCNKQLGPGTKEKCYPIQNILYNQTTIQNILLCYNCHQEILM